MHITILSTSRASMSANKSTTQCQKTVDTLEDGVRRVRPRMCRADARVSTSLVTDPPRAKRLGSRSGVCGLPRRYVSFGVGVSYNDGLQRCWAGCRLCRCCWRCWRTVSGGGSRLSIGWRCLRISWSCLSV